MTDIHTSVTSYSSTTGILTLRHNYPPGSEVEALVDVNLVLEMITSEQVRHGEWVNIVGYISAGSQSSLAGFPEQRASNVSVQALLLWSSGPINVQEYEASLSSFG